MTAPTIPGAYLGSATGSKNGFLGSFTVIVESATGDIPATGPGEPGEPGLPVTGSDGVSQTTVVAVGLIFVGAAMFGVAQIRRRQTLAEQPPAS